MISIRRIPAVLLPGLLLAGCSGSHGHMNGMTGDLDDLVAYLKTLR